MTDEEIREMQKQIDAEVKGEKLDQQTTIEFGVHGPQPEEAPPEGGETKPPEGGETKPPPKQEQLNSSFNDYFKDVLEKV